MTLKALDAETTLEPINESKADKFIRLAEKRTQKVLQYIDSLSNLSNLNTYEYEQGDIDKISRAISDAFEACKDKLYHKEPEVKLFSLKD